MVAAERIGPLLVLVGETGSGKSALALELARCFGSEILCADSATVRRGVDIGSAKPTPEERALVPHHLLDVVGPCEQFTAAEFKRLALGVIDDVLVRGRLPLVAGGTGLYVDGLVYDYMFLPRPAPGSREALGRLSATELREQAVNAGLSLSGVDVSNKRRLLRLIETGGVRAQRGTLRPGTLMMGIQLERDVLRQRIVARTDAMLAAGLEREVRELAARYGWECAGLQGIGYREWREYFAGMCGLPEVRQRIIKSTLGLAKRQRTWFNRNKDIHWLSGERITEEAVELVTTFLASFGRV